MSNTITQRIALVTGANRGIGHAIAKSLIDDHGFRVIAVARQENDALAAAESLGPNAVPTAMNLASSDAVIESAQRILRELGPVDVLINNAGVLYSGTGLDISPNGLTESLQVNTVAPFILIQVFGPAMKQQGWGRIVNVSSQWGAFDEGLTGPAAYSISKAALNAVTLTFAQSLGRAVKVNAACPGWVRTRMGGEAASRSPEQGADTPVWLATLPNDGPTGGFFADRRLVAW